MPSDSMAALLLKTLVFAAVTSAAAVGSIGKDLKPVLSQAAEIYTPGGQAFDDAKTRWAANINPAFDAIVKVTSEKDVQSTVSSADHRRYLQPAHVSSSHMRTSKTYHSSFSTVVTDSPRP